MAPSSPPSVKATMVKRESTDELDADHSDSTRGLPPPDAKPRLVPRTPKKAKTNPSSVSISPSSSLSGGGGGGGGSARSQFAEMIFEAGIKAVKKDEVYQATGLKPNQQQEMIRKDKGALRRAFNNFIAGL